MTAPYLGKKALRAVVERLHDRVDFLAGLRHADPDSLREAGRIHHDIDLLAKNLRVPRHVPTPTDKATRE